MWQNSLLFVVLVENLSTGATNPSKITGTKVGSLVPTKEGSVNPG